MTLQGLLVLVVALVSLPTTIAINVPFSSSTTPTYKRSKWTVQVPAPTPAPDLLFRRDQSTCGVPEGGYTDAPPVCSGSASFCTFTGSTGYQGCCEGQSPNSCTFYTTCYEHSERASCTGACTSSALVCPSSAPECTRYIYQYEPSPPISHWTGFGCGSQSATIYAFAVNGIEQSQSAKASATPSGPSSSASSNSPRPNSSSETTNSHAHSSTHEPTSSQTILPPPTGPSSSSTSSTAAGATASSSGTSNPSIPQSHNHRGAIAGGVVGGFIAFAILLAVVILWRIHGKRNERAGMAPMSQRELGQPWTPR